MMTTTYGSCAVKAYYFDDEPTCLSVRDDSTAFGLSNDEDEASLLSWFTAPKEQFTLQLQNATLTEVMDRYMAYSQIKSPGYTNTASAGFLRDIQSRMGGASIAPSQVNEIFYAKAQLWLSKVRHLKNSTIQTYFRQISAALSWGAQYGVRLSPGYNKFDVPDYEGAKYALTLEEVCMVYDFDPTKLMKDAIKVIKATIPVEVPCIRHLKNGRTTEYIRHTTQTIEVETTVQVPRFRAEHIDKLVRVRDMFVLCCMLMQRYSDMRRITPECFNASRTQFSTTQKKTGRRAYVNLHNLTMSEDITMKILKKYGFYAPYSGNTNNFNATLHELLDLIGGRFHETVRIENKVNGELVTEDVRLCDCITSHCGRRSGITSAICSGINAPRVMRASGHADYRTFEGYIRRCVDDVNE